MKDKIWWEYLGGDLQELLKESETLTELFRLKPETGKNFQFHDYSFIVFPAAKAYEGFLKKFFLDMGFIDKENYWSKHFRVGKSLNPALIKELGNGSVYTRIVKYCNGKALADMLWDTWRLSRNLVFHWFPNEVNALSFDEAKIRIEAVLGAIDAAFKECKPKSLEKGLQE